MKELAYMCLIMIIVLMFASGCISTVKKENTTSSPSVENISSSSVEKITSYGIKSTTSSSGIKSSSGIENIKHVVLV